ncbi:hypothetical protein C7408_1545 [Paraburkholderia caballeronis]|nr:hypothetical protein C7408_1545 [Paraburkholderia caballeronis]TDV05569.1 hypothetical protein C7406_1525 [Paraburkholderia caballeronis]TDV15340.1 hypothetical protein C7404_1545 [Paraburkholderia caballeronis]
MSLGLFGKISIGDDRAGTSLAQTLSAQLIERMIFEATYPMIGDVQFKTADFTVYPTGTNSDGVNQAHVKNQIMLMFTSGNLDTRHHTTRSPW